MPMNPSLLPGATSSVPSNTNSIDPPPESAPAPYNPNALSNNGVVNLEVLKREKERTTAKYTTHEPTPKEGETKASTMSDEDQGLLNAVKNIGEALHASGGGKLGGK